MSSDCIFCKIIAGQIPCHKVAETEKSLAFLDINPLSDGHTLVIPKEHQQKAHELSAESLSDCAKLLGKVAAVVGGENYNVLQNNGADAGQVVMHVHFHVIPRTGTDGFRVKFESGETDHPKFARLAEEYRAKLAA